MITRKDTPLALETRAILDLEIGLRQSSIVRSPVFFPVCPTIRLRAAFPLSTGGEASVRWAFVEEAKVQPDYPRYMCPSTIVHGVNDAVVPPVASRSLVEGRWVKKTWDRREGANKKPKIRC